MTTEQNSASIATSLAVEPEEFEKGLDEVYLYGVVAMVRGFRAGFSIACSGPVHVEQHAIQYVELAERVAISGDDVQTIAFLGRCDRDETYKREKWFLRDLVQRGCAVIQLPDKLLDLIPDLGNKQEKRS